MARSMKEFADDAIQDAVSQEIYYQQETGPLVVSAFAKYLNVRNALDYRIDMLKIVIAACLTESKRLEEGREEGKNVAHSED